MARDLCIQMSKKSLKRAANAMKLQRDQILAKIIHYHDKDHFDETFHKTALAWANENDDPITVSDLLHLEKSTHEDKEEGLQCIKGQLTNDRLLYWITRTFTRFYPHSPCKMWTKALIISVLQICISYFLFIFDIFTDFQLKEDYADAFNNIQNYTSLMLQCARVNTFHKNVNLSQSCFSFNDQYPKITYEVAYYLTYASLLFSLVAYFIGIIFVFDMKNLTEKKCKKPSPEKLNNKCVWLHWQLKMLFLGIIIRIFWPFFHLYRKLRYERSEVKSSRRKKFIEFETIWIMVKTIEYGIEATIQLIIVLYLLVPYYDEIHHWDLQTTVKKTSAGIFHFLTLGKYEACLLEKVVGKAVMNVFFQSLSLTILKYMKYGMTLPEQISNMLPTFASNICQIIARIYALRVFFVTAEDFFSTDNKGLAIGLFFLIHFVGILLIKFTFEVRKENFKCINFDNTKFWMKFIINLLSSFFIYVRTNEYGTKPRENPNQHNSFLPQLCFQILVLIEHLIMIIYPLGLVTNDCLDRVTYSNTAWIVPCLWLASNFFTIYHYKDCHTWSQTNGPSFKFNELDYETDEESPKSRCTKCPDPQISCYTYLCCFEDNVRLSFGKQGFKIERSEKKKLDKIATKTNDIEMNGSCDPLMGNNSICSTFNDKLD